MPVVHKSMRVPYSAQQMYDLVNDIHHYPKFIPACEASHILVQTEDEIRASLTFYKNGLRKSFETLNRLNPYKMIEIRLIHGPFKHLEGFWRFLPLMQDSEVNVDSGDDIHGNLNSAQQGCEITLDLEFEFSSSILKMMFGPIFHQITIMLVEAFQVRAQCVYGESSFCDEKKC